MSLILDALKKLDRDRAAGNAGRRDLSAEILKAGDSPRRSGLVPRVITLGVTACVAALVTFLAVGGPGPRKGGPSPAPFAAPVQAPPAAPAPVPPVPAETAGKHAQAPTTPPGTPAPPEAAAAAKQPGRETGDIEPAAKGRASARQDHSKKAPARSGENEAVRPAVKISGIVWQEERSERKAMINGRVAREGETVDGMKILEIHPTRVKLSYDGKSFNAGMFE